MYEVRVIYKSEGSKWIIVGTGDTLEEAKERTQEIFSAANPHAIETLFITTARLLCTEVVEFGDDDG